MSMGNRELEGRVALVTGASRNIGRATALALAEGGAAVLVNARVSVEEAKAVAREIESKGGQAIALVADVTDEKAVGAMVEQGLQRFGRLDILVNNAAVRGVSDIDAIDAAEFRRISGIILDGAFICVKAALAGLRASGQGAIVNVGGMSGHTGARGRPHVVAAKMGLVGLTRALARQRGSEHDARHDVMDCLAEVIWNAQRYGTAFDNASYLDCVRRKA